MTPRTKIALALIASLSTSLALAADTGEGPGKEDSTSTAISDRHEITLPAMAQSKWELDTLGERGISTAMDVEPLLKVHPSRLKNAKALIEAKQAAERGERVSGAVELTPAQPSPDMNGVPRVVGQSGEPEQTVDTPAVKPLTLVPGQPVVVQTTLQGAIEAKAREEEGIPAPVLINIPETPQAAARKAEVVGTMAPSIGSIRPEDSVPDIPEAPRAIPATEQGEIEIVPFEMLNPSTWGPAYNAYLAPHISPKLAAGLAILFFIVAFILGRAAAQGGRER